MGIAELIVVLVVALIVVPPEKLPEVMRTVGKVLRELRLASNTVMRELSDVAADPLSIRQPPAAIAKPSLTAPPSPSPAQSQAPDGES
ncbi:MAG: twin-arginine translocase TatA/TatE family subunit [Candidatus Binataceae bacterium]